jgi:hypothetical protein
MVTYRNSPGLKKAREGSAERNDMDTERFGASLE